jgi:hypothetical protein
MKTLYIDNSILGREQDWGSITALRKSTPGLRAAISDWHMVELASGSDRAQVLKRADFIDSLNPLWMHGYLPIQRWEVKRFIWQHYYRVPAEESSVFTEHLSEVWSTYVGPQTVIGMDARRWVAIVHDLSDLNSEKVKIIGALSTLQTATPQQKKQIEQETFLRWILPRINDRDPGGQAMTARAKIEIANFCYDNKTVFYSICPAMAVESELHKIRSRDVTRQPKASDAIDLFHGVLGLSFCDYYVTRDGFARQCAIYAKKALPSLRTAEIYESLSDLSAVLSSIDENVQALTP